MTATGVTCIFQRSTTQHPISGLQLGSKDTNCFLLTTLTARKAANVTGLSTH